MSVIEQVSEYLSDYYVGEDINGLIFIIPHGKYWALLRLIILTVLMNFIDREDESI